MMRYCESSTPVGRLLLAGDEEGLRMICFQNGPRPVEPAGEWRRTEKPFREALAQLDSYFAGELRKFDLALSPEGTPFQRMVWSALTTIPYGETVSYGELARAARKTGRNPGGGRRQWSQPDPDRHPLS